MSCDPQEASRAARHGTPWLVWVLGFAASTALGVALGTFLGWVVS